MAKRIGAKAKYFWIGNKLELVNSEDISKKKIDEQLRAVDRRNSTFLILPPLTAVTDAKL
jgi:hypothetical protein